MRYQVLGSFSCPYCKQLHQRSVEHCPNTGRPLTEVQKMGGTLLESRYRIGEILAEGGMGIVYLGFQKGVDRPVAIKFLNPDLCSSTETSERFMQEARLAARIDHPGIVKVFDLGSTQEGIPYIVMEYLQGSDLSARIREAGRLDPGEALGLTEQILQVLTAVHASGIVHRDLKPENVFLARQSGGSVVVKVLDFGVSRLVQNDGKVRRITEAGRVYGTPHYVSPEQARGRLDVDHRSDLYSVSVILFEMLIGTPPFQGDSPVGLMLDIVSMPPPNPLEVRPDLPPAVAGIMLRGLEKDPRDRFQSASEMSAALKLARRVERYRRQQPRKKIRTPLRTGAYRIMGPPTDKVTSEIPLKHLLESSVVPGPTGIGRTTLGSAARRESTRTRPMPRDRQDTPSRRTDVTPNPDMGDPEE